MHSQMTAATERAALRYAQNAAATSAELRNSPILFVPIGGNMCRRRWIDNTTWTLRDFDFIDDMATVLNKPKIFKPVMHKRIRR